MAQISQSSRRAQILYHLISQFVANPVSENYHSKCLKLFSVGQIEFRIDQFYSHEPLAKVSPDLNQETPSRRI